MIDSLIQVERQRLIPVQDRKAAATVELESYNIIKEGLDTLKETIDTLASNVVWEGKIVESSDESVVTATASTGASPGKSTLIVDQLALNHQRASQGFESPDDPIGTGRFTVSIGEDAPVSAVIDDTNNTLNGLKDAINSVSDDVRATIIKTGNKIKPYQLILTSQKTGSVGRINLDISLQGDEVPSFENAFELPSEWTGIGAPIPEGLTPLTGTGASTAIVRVIGEYTGEEDNEFSFTAIQTGIVGGEDGLQLRWKDELGRSGIIQLDKFNYSPGEPLPLIDNLSLLISQGEIVVGDTFTVRARAEKSSRFWQFSAEDRQAKVFPPSAWGRQSASAGQPVVEGDYTGEEDVDIKITVEGSGQIGTSKDLRLLWETTEGDVGFLPVGRGYRAGSKLALIDGLTIALKPGVLTDGSTMEFSATAPEISSKWWKADAERVIEAEISGVGPFDPPEGLDEDEIAGLQPEFPEELGPRISSTKVEISGTFEGDDAKVYTFTALKDGTVGITGDLRVQWEDEKENTGEIAIGGDYTLGTPIPFDLGLSIAFNDGRVFETDSFNVRTRTSTIQPPQDAIIRLGATVLGGGLEITSSSNELDSVIDGVKLSLVGTSVKPVTITIRGDVDKAIETTLKFAEDFNALVESASELSKFDQERNVAGPLLGDRDLADIRDRLADLLIDPVPGLPRDGNMIFTLGMRLNTDGILEVDEATLRGKIEDDFAAVADIFRDKGSSDNSGIAFVGLTDQTVASPNGYPVDITQVATQGSYTTPLLGSTVEITEDNNKFFVTVDGRRSEQLTIPPNTYAVTDYSRALQNAITNDSAVGKSGVRVTVDGAQIQIASGRYGSRSGIAFTAPEDGFEAGVGLLNGSTSPGLDVAGTIDGELAVGVGRLLRGADESKQINGLRLLVTLTEAQLSLEAPETIVKITKGVASRINEYLGRILDPRTGRIKTISDNLGLQIKDVDERLERMEERIESKRDQLLRKFAKLESTMGSLRNQQGFMRSQLAGLPGAGGGGGGLPGL